MKIPAAHQVIAETREELKCCIERNIAQLDPWTNDQAMGLWGTEAQAKEIRDLCGQGIAVLVVQDERRIVDAIEVRYMRHHIDDACIHRIVLDPIDHDAIALILGLHCTGQK
ncbi:MAG: hypothetical protein K8H89_04965 [Flavobacteriales bacterium]|nr:hypothetical protein [Flavobacteriales bacterium]